MLRDHPQVAPASPGDFLDGTKGEDKPLKYPAIFNTSDVPVLSKMDLVEAVESDRAAAHESVQSVRPERAEGALA